MAKNKHSPEQIIQKLCKVEVPLVEGATIADAIRQLEVTKRTYNRWRNEYGRMRTDQARSLGA